jgi:hypothetical protein
VRSSDQASLLLDDGFQAGSKYSHHAQRHRVSASDSKAAILVWSGRSTTALVTEAILGPGFGLGSDHRSLMSLLLPRIRECTRTDHPGVFVECLTDQPCSLFAISAILRPW